MPAWLPIALMIASAAANKKAQSRVQDERGRRSSLERLRQAQLGEEADRTMRDVLASQERPQIDLNRAQAADIREGKYNAAAPPPSAAGEYIVNPSAPQEVRTEMADSMVRALDRGRQQAKSLAKLGGRSDAAFGTNVALGRSAQNLNRIGEFSRGSSRVLPYELEAANYKGENWRTIADLFQLGSMASGFYNMSTVPTQTAAPVTDYSRIKPGWGAGIGGIT